ncbi:MAG: hypothetical protein ACYDAH_20290, partial [Steroidobacteraceae bacterium]
ERIDLLLDFIRVFNLDLGTDLEIGAGFDREGAASRGGGCGWEKSARTAAPLGTRFIARSKWS